MTETPEQILKRNLRIHSDEIMFSVHGDTGNWRDIILAMEEFSESSTKELQSEITQLKEVNESCYQSNKMLEEENDAMAGMLIDSQKFIDQLKAKLEVADKALKESYKHFKILADSGRYPEHMIADNGGDGLMFLVNALTKINT